MGGFNSGRSRSKTYLEQLPHIKLKDVQEYFGDTQEDRRVTSTLTWASGDRASLTYNPEGLRLSFSANGQVYSQQVNAAYTPCTYGGRGRPWMLCPCSGRTNKLFLHRLRFVCRSCVGLRYRSQSLAPEDRLAIKIQKLQKKLDRTGEHDIWARPPRPKGMHSSTYSTVTRKLVLAAGKREAVLDVRLAAVVGRLEGMEGLREALAPSSRPKKGGFWA